MSARMVSVCCEAEPTSELDGTLGRCSHCKEGAVFEPDIDTETQAHTPGPWAVHEYALDDDGSWFYAHTIMDGDGDFICHTSFTRLWGGNTFQAQANARLIAAAPDLLEACEKVMSHWSFNRFTGQEVANVLATVRAAIAKAKAS